MQKFQSYFLIDGTSVNSSLLSFCKVILLGGGGGRFSLKTIELIFAAFRSIFTAQVWQLGTWNITPWRNCRCCYLSLPSDRGGNSGTSEQSFVYLNPSMKMLALILIPSASLCLCKLKGQGLSSLVLTGINGSKWCALLWNHVLGLPDYLHSTRVLCRAHVGLDSRTHVPQLSRPRDPC